MLRGLAVRSVLVYLDFALKQSELLALCFAEFGLCCLQFGGQALRCRLTHAAEREHLRLQQTVTSTNRDTPLVMLFLQQGSTALWALGPASHGKLSLNDHWVNFQRRIRFVKLRLHHMGDLVRIRCSLVRFVLGRGQGAQQNSQDAQED